jgi:hypothetical protein
MSNTCRCSAVPVLAISTMSMPRRISTRRVADPSAIRASLCTGYCWGYGFNGEIGDGVHDSHPVPTPVKF